MQRYTVLSSEKERRSRKIVTILLVDNDDDTGELLVQAISRERHHYVHIAHSCHQALIFVQHVKPTLCLVDYHLPGGSGLDLIDQIHARDELEVVPIVFMTAHNRMFRLPMEQQHCVAIEKPFELATLLQVLKQQLHSPVLAIP